MLDEKENRSSANSLSEFDVKIQYPKLIFKPIICSKPINMAKHLTKDLEFNNDELGMNHLPLAGMPETIVGQLDITEWSRHQLESIDERSFEYFTLPDLQMPNHDTDDKTSLASSNESIPESPLWPDKISNHRGLGLFQRMTGMSTAMWNIRPCFIEAKKMRARVSEFSYIGEKKIITSISNTFRQAFPKSLLDVLCNLRIALDTDSSEGGSFTSSNLNIFLEDGQSIESNEDSLIYSMNGDDKESETNVVLNQLFKIDSVKYNPLLEIDEEDEKKMVTIQQYVDRSALSVGANKESRIGDMKDKPVTPGANISNQIADPKDILNSGIQIFSEHIELFCVENYKQWKRCGEGDIQIWKKADPVLTFYVLLWDGITNKLLIHIKVGANWKIEYEEKSSGVCNWLNYNYARSPRGKLERLSCHFSESSSAARFVSLVDKCVGKLLLV